MADSTPAAAVAEFLGSLRQAIACVTRARVEVSADGYRPNPQGRAHLLSVNRGEPVAVGGDQFFSLPTVAFGDAVGVMRCVDRPPLLTATLGRAAWIR